MFLYDVKIEYYRLLHQLFIFYYIMSFVSVLLDAFALSNRVKNRFSFSDIWLVDKSYFSSQSNVRTINSVMIQLLSANAVNIRGNLLNIIWRPPSQSELTTMIFDMGLTHIGSEAPIWFR